MNEVTLDKMTLRGGVKCYGGCFDSASSRVFKELDRVLKLIKIREPEAHVTYFPVEEYYTVHVWGRSISGEFTNLSGALYDAYCRLYP